MAKGAKTGGGSRKGIPNKSTATIKQMLSSVYTDEEQIAMWNKWRLHEDPRIASEWDKLAIAYLYGKPKEQIEHSGSIDLASIIEGARRRDPD